MMKSPRESRFTPVEWTPTWNSAYCLPGLETFPGFRRKSPNRSSRQRSFEATNNSCHFKSEDCKFLALSAKSAYQPWIEFSRCWSWSDWNVFVCVDVTEIYWFHSEIVSIRCVFLYPMLSGSRKILELGSPRFQVTRHFLLWNGLSQSSPRLMAGWRLFHPHL